ncbi:unnamed protein product [Alternaria alternata]
MGDAASLSDNKPTLEAAEADFDRSPAEEIFRRKLDPLEEKTWAANVTSFSRFIAKKLCRTFADKFYVTLPCELREMVYDYVWDWTMLCLTFDDVTLTAISNGRGPKSCLEPYLARKTTVVASIGGNFRAGRTIECVGMYVATEVVKAYYRSTRSLSVEPDHLEDLTDLVYRDHFHLGVKPLDHIRRLEIPLRQDVLIGRGEQTRCKLQSTEGLETFRYHLEVLLNVRVKKGFQLTILLTWHAFHIYCMPALERSRAVVNKSLTEDAKVSVLAWDIEGLEEYDVSDYYTLSSVDWQKKWIWKVQKDHRRKGHFSGYDDFGTFPSGF